MHAHVPAVATKLQLDATRHTARTLTGLHLLSEPAHTPQMVLVAQKVS
jgi:hypothetical protein